MAQGQVEKSLINLYQDFRAIGYIVFCIFITTKGWRIKNAPKYFPSLSEVPNMVEVSSYAHSIENFRFYKIAILVFHI